MHAVLMREDADGGGGGGPSASLGSAQRSEGGAHLMSQELGLFEGREVAALVELVVMDEPRIGPLGPAPRALIELVGKGAHGNGDGDVHRHEEGKLVFPIEARRGNRRTDPVPGESDRRN